LAQAGAVLLAAIAAGAQGSIDNTGDNSTQPRIRGELDTDSQGQSQVAIGALRGSEDTGLYRTVPLVARPYDEIARRETGVTIEETGDWRHTDGQTVGTGHVGAAFAVADGLRVTGGVDDVEINARNVYHVGGPIPLTRYVTNDLSGALGFAYDLTSADQFGGQALYGVNGVGGLLSLDHEWQDGKLGMSAVYNEPYLVSAEAVADHASRSGGEIDLAQHIAHGLWAHAQLNYTRYQVQNDQDAARTIGFNGNVYYTTKAFGGIWGLRYDIDGEYVASAHKYPIGAGMYPFTPLDIRSREIHAGSASVGVPIWDDFGFDLYGGYAYDRFTHGDVAGIQQRSMGPFAGAEFRFKAGPGLELSLGGHYAAVPNLPGEKGPETSAGLNLVYRLDDDPAPPGWPL
jgi:hypothetical protein